MKPPRVYAFEGMVPVVDPTAFVHPSAVLIGDVMIGAGVFIGPCASLRGDFGRLIVMAGSNIQDGCVMHGFPGTDTVVEEYGHVGHGAVLHGCTLRRNVMIGMNAVIMDEAEIGESAIVAASSFVKTGMRVPPRVLVAGVPGRVVRELSDEDARHGNLSGTGTPFAGHHDVGGRASSGRAEPSSAGQMIVRVRPADPPAFCWRARQERGQRRVSAA